MKTRYEYRKSKYCVYAIDLDYRLPSGNLRVWVYDKNSPRIKFFGDEISRKCADETLEPADEAETAELRAELRKNFLL